MNSVSESKNIEHPDINGAVKHALIPDHALGKRQGKKSSVGKHGAVMKDAPFQQASFSERKRTNSHSEQMRCGGTQKCNKQTPHVFRGILYMGKAAYDRNRQYQIEQKVDHAFCVLTSKDTEFICGKADPRNHIKHEYLNGDGFKVFKKQDQTFFLNEIRQAAANAKTPVNKNAGAEKSGNASPAPPINAIMRGRDRTKLSTP